MISRILLLSIALTLVVGCGTSSTAPSATSSASSAASSNAALTIRAAPPAESASKSTSPTAPATDPRSEPKLRTEPSVEEIEAVVREFYSKSGQLADGAKVDVVSGPLSPPPQLLNRGKFYEGALGYYVVVAPKSESSSSAKIGPELFFVKRYAGLFPGGPVGKVSILAHVPKTEIVSTLGPDWAAQHPAEK